MKRIVAASLISALLTGGAGAYQAPNVNTYYSEYICSEQINNDPVAQADFLHALGLFNGTENGYELSRAMNRAEAAAMLVRFLGAEDKVLAGTFSHPFTDVPQWADGYVGWLYENGVTQGVSATAYGAANAVTVLQYATFLSRALAGNDEYEKNGVLTENEVFNAQCSDFFNREMAVGLSVRALALPHTAGGDTRTMAQYLIEQGAFTEKQFTKAAWNVLPVTYAVKENGDIVSAVAGIEYGCNADGLTLVANSALRRDRGVLYACKQIDGETAVYALDPQMLKATALGVRKAAGTIGYLGVMNGREYLFETNGALLSADGKALSEVLTAEELTKNGFVPEVRVSDGYDRLSALIVTAPDGLYLISSNSETPALLDTGDDTKIVAQGTEWSPFLITGPEDGKAGSLRCFDLRTGELTDSADVAADAVWKQNDWFLYGKNGLYQVVQERYWLDDEKTEYENRLWLRFWTDMPVYGVETTRRNAGPGDPYVLTGENGPEKMVALDSDGPAVELVSFADYGLTDVTVERTTAAFDSTPYFFARNGKDAGVYAYRVIGDSLLPSYYISDSGTADSEAMCAAEQARVTAIKQTLSKEGTK